MPLDHSRDPRVLAVLRAFEQAVDGRDEDECDEGRAALDGAVAELLGAAWREPDDAACQRADDRHKERA